MVSANSEDVTHVNSGQSSVINGDNAKVKSKQKIKNQTNTHFQLILTPGAGSSVNTESSPEYSTKWSWKSPLTQASLTWIGTITGLLGLAQAYGYFAPLVAALSGGLHSLGAVSQSTPPTIFMFGFLAAVAISAAAFSMRRIVKHRLRVLSKFKQLPAAISMDGRFALAKFSGKCPVCGGRLRFYNKPVAWKDITRENGSTKTVVADREMAAECVRNPRRHWWYVDTAEERVS